MTYTKLSNARGTPYPLNPLMNAMSLPLPAEGVETNPSRLGGVASGGETPLNSLRLMAEQRPSFGTPIQVASIGGLGFDQDNGWIAGSVLLAATIAAAVSVAGTGIPPAWLAWLAAGTLLEIGLVSPDFLSTPFDIASSAIATLVGATEFGSVTEWSELPELLADKIIAGEIPVSFGGENGNEFIFADRNANRNEILSMIKKTGIVEVAEGMFSALNEPGGTLNGVPLQEYYQGVLASVNGDEKLASEKMATAIAFYANKNGLQVPINARGDIVDANAEFKAKEAEMLRSFKEIGADPNSIFPDNSGKTLLDKAKEYGGGIAGTYMAAFRANEARNPAPADEDSNATVETAPSCSELTDEEIAAVRNYLSTYPPNQRETVFNEAQLRMLYGEPACEQETRLDTAYRHMEVDRVGRPLPTESYRRPVDEATPYEECLESNHEWENAHVNAANGDSVPLKNLRSCEEGFRQAWRREALYTAATANLGGPPPKSPEEHERDMYVHGKLAPQERRDPPVAGTVVAGGFILVTSALTASTAGAGVWVGALGAAVTAFIRGEENSKNGFGSLFGRLVDSNRPRGSMPESNEAIVAEIMRTSVVPLLINRDGLQSTQEGLWDTQRGLYYQPETHQYFGFNEGAQLSDGSYRWIPTDNSEVYLDGATRDSVGQPLFYNVNTKQYQAVFNNNFLPYDPRVSLTKENIETYARKIYMPERNPRALNGPGNGGAGEGIITNDNPEGSEEVDNTDAATERSLD